MHLQFEPLEDSHFALIHKWFNQPHVQKFYSLRKWTLEEVQKKLLPYLTEGNSMRCFIIHYGKRPIGYVQSYPVVEHPWENQDLSERIIQEAAGIDLFIGEENYLNKGLGTAIVNSYLEQYIWPIYRYCLADPDIRNRASLRLFEKCGFAKHTLIFSKNALHKPVTLQLFIKERPEEGKRGK